MRTGNDLIRRVFSLLGYIGKGTLSDFQAVKEHQLYGQACSAVMQIYSDLSSQDPLGKADIEIEDMNQIIPLSFKTVNDIMPYGVAMLVAESAGEESALAFYTEAYNRKRTYIEKAPICRRDVLPRGGGKDGWKS